MRGGHRVRLDVTPPPPGEVDAGAILRFRISASCEHGCDLRGLPVRVMAGDEVLALCDLVAQEEVRCETADLEIRAPAEVGKHTWTVELSPEEEATHHAEHVEMRVHTRPHACSMAVWDVPTPVGRGDVVDIKVGARCSSGCCLAASDVEVRDAQGGAVARGVLGDTPWDGTAALYWTTIRLTASAREGVNTHTVAFAPAAVPLAHDDATSTFTYRVDKPRQHRMTVKVLKQADRTPISRVEVRCGPYRGSTDDRGIAIVMLPEGTFDITIRRDGFEARPCHVVVNKDLSVEIAALTVPTRAERADRALKDYPWG